MLRLVAEQLGDNAGVKVRWCLSKEARAKLIAEEAENPMLLLVTVGRFNKESRKLVPLSDMMAYLFFSSPGINRIFGAVVWGEKKRLWSILVRGEAFGDNLFGFSTDEKRDRLALRSVDFLRDEHGLTAQDMLEVDVPKEHFAKERPEWLASWVNRWQDGPHKDDCQFRRRAIFAFTLQPLLLFVAKVYILTSKTVLSVALVFCFMRRTRRYLRELWKRPLLLAGKEYWNYLFSSGDSPFLTAGPIRKDWPYPTSGTYYAENDPSPRVWSIPLFPPFLVLLVMTGLIFNILWLVLVAVTTYVALSWVVIGILFTSRQRREKKPPVQEEPEKSFNSAKLEHVLSLVACNGDMTTDLGALPREARTLRLRYYDLKARVCKPTAR